MNLLRPIRPIYRAVFRRDRAERDMHEEMNAHLERAVERLRARGLSEGDARALARRDFGNVAYLQEEARDVRGGRWLETLGRDVRFAFRYFARTPLTAATLVLVLALGIGVNSALFSILQALLLRPAPAVPTDDALVRIRGTTFQRTEGSLQSRGLSLLEVNDLATRTGTFAAVAGYATDELVFDAGDGSDPRVVRGHFVTPNFFATLGVRPTLGPGLPVGRTDDAPGAELAVMIGHRLWEQIGGDSSSIGRVVRLNNMPVRIVGVAPPGFQGPVIESGNPQFWMLVAARAPLTRSTGHALASRDSALFDAIGRLTPGTTVEQATAVVRVVSTAWTPEKKPDENADHSSDVVALRGFTEVTNEGETAMVIALVGIGGLLVLLVVCTNVSALLVGAAVARRREVAIRLSLGASRGRIIRQLLTETSLVALAGGALGLTLYWWIIKLVVWLLGEVPIGPDLGTVAFTAFAALGTGVVFGLSPALHATRLDVATALKSSGGGTSSRSRLQRGFIVAQIVLTQPLLVGIAMVIGVVMGEASGQTRSSLKERVIHIQFGMYGGAGSRSERVERVAGVMERVAGLPGVDEVMPQSTAFDIGDWRVHSADRGTGPRAQETVRAHLEGAAPGYLTFQGLRVVRGRDLLPADTLGRGMMAVVVASDFARSFWGAEDPIGRRLEMTSRRFTNEMRAAVVVGVFDTTGAPLRGAGRVYTADGSRWRKDVYLVRTRGPGTAVIPAIRQLTRTELPDVPIYGNGIATLAQLDRIERNEVMQISAGATAGGLVALLLASIGLYGVVALAVRQRHREIGVRVALGARPQQVIRMFFVSGVRLSMLGTLLGLPLSVVALYVIASQFAESMPLNMPLVGAAIAVSVIGVASLASWIPARRAAVVDPLVAMRAE